MPMKTSRQISSIPYKVLDAPQLLDDYYLNLVDWSDSNNLVVGLSSCVYTWNASNSEVSKLADLS
jgi:cell division cycle 20-like protein 1 (cofactor of APC complex)